MARWAGLKYAMEAREQAVAAEHAAAAMIAG